MNESQTVFFSAFPIDFGGSRYTGELTSGKYDDNNMPSELEQSIPAAPWQDAYMLAELFRSLYDYFDQEIFDEIVEFSDLNSFIEENFSTDTSATPNQFKFSIEDMIRDWENYAKTNKFNIQVIKAPLTEIKIQLEAGMDRLGQIRVLEAGIEWMWQIRLIEDARNKLLQGCEYCETVIKSTTIARSLESLRIVVAQVKTNAELNNALAALVFICKLDSNSAPTAAPSAKRYKPEFWGASSESPVHDHQENTLIHIRKLLPEWLHTQFDLEVRRLESGDILSTNATRRRSSGEVNCYTRSL